MDFKYYGLVNTSNVLRPYRLPVIYLSSLSPSLISLPHPPPLFLPGVLEGSLTARPAEAHPLGWLKPT